MTQLTTHFTLEEMIFSPTAARLGIDNTPTPAIMQRLGALAMALEMVRALLCKPIHIDSGYRCVQLNRAVGGVPDSAHVLGYAADFVCPAFGTPLQIVTAIQASGIKFDQLIFEQTWVHLSVAPLMRQEVLTARFNAQGRASYTTGVHA